MPSHKHNNNRIKLIVIQLSYFLNLVLTLKVYFNNFTMFRRRLTCIKIKFYLEKTYSEHYHYVFYKSIQSV